MELKGGKRTVVCEWKEPDNDLNSSHQATDEEMKFSSIPITDSEVCPT